MNSVWVVAQNSNTVWAESHLVPLVVDIASSVQLTPSLKQIQMKADNSPEMISD